MDDERFARTLYADYLRAAGYAVEVAEDAPAALRVLEHRRFDVLLTDMVMPDGLSGLDLARRLRRDDPLLRVISAPVTDFAAITQYATPEVVMLVRSDSPYKSLKDLVERVEAAMVQAPSAPTRSPVRPVSRLASRSNSGMPSFRACARRPRRWA